MKKRYCKFMFYGWTVLLAISSYHMCTRFALGDLLDFEISLMFVIVFFFRAHTH